MLTCMGGFLVGQRERKRNGCLSSRIKWKVRWDSAEGSTRQRDEKPKYQAAVRGILGGTGGLREGTAELETAPLLLHH